MLNGRTRRAPVAQAATDLEAYLEGEEAIPDDTPPAFIGLRTKAQMYLERGPAGYRARDAFQMPRVESPRGLRKIRSGMEQIVLFRGYSLEKPFRGIGIEGFYALMQTLHLELERQKTVSIRASLLVDEMRMKHRVTGRGITLFNAVRRPVPGRKSRGSSDRG